MPAASGNSQGSAGEAHVSSQSDDVPYSAGIPAMALPQLRSGGALRGTAPKPAPSGGSEDRGSTRPSFPRKAGPQRQPGKEHPAVVKGLTEDSRSRYKFDPSAWEEVGDGHFRAVSPPPAAKPAPVSRKTSVTIEDVTDSLKTAAISTATTGGPGSSSGKWQQQSPVQLDKEAFAEAVKIEFASLMGAGGAITPNQAAVLALEIVKKQQGM